jgi:hypothetical protein
MRQPIELRVSWGFCVVVLACGLAARTAGAIAIDIGDATAAPGGIGLFAVRLHAMGAEVAGTQNEIGFAPPIRIAARANGVPDCAVNPHLNKGATSFGFEPRGCVGTGCTSVRAFVLSFDNSDPIPDNSVLYTCHFEVRADAAAGGYPLVNSGLGASNRAGVFLSASGKNGSVTVRPSGVAIDIDDAEATPGGDVEVGVHLRNPDGTVVATQNRIDFSPPLRIAANRDGAPDCTVNPAIDKPATSFHFLPNRCVGAECTAVRAVVLSFDGPASIPDGSLLYTCRLTVDAGASAGAFPLRNSETAGSDAHADLLPATGRNGTITVLEDDADVAVTVGITRAVSGQRALVPVRLEYLHSAVDVAGTQNELVFDRAAPIAARLDGTPDCTANPNIDKDATDFLFLPLDCTPGIDCERVRAFVLALDNTDPIPDGSVLYRCAVQVASDASVGSYPLRSDNAVASDSRGNPVAARGRAGRVDVICAGDCDENGQVAIFELLRGVNILLGNDALAACRTFDSDGSGDVNVNEIVQAVSSALRGCRFAD